MALQAGRTETAGTSALRGGATSCRPRADPYSPEAPCPAPCHTRQGSAIEEDRAPGLPGPAFSRALATQNTHVPGSGAASPAPHPPLLNFNGRHPAHLAPHSGANRRRRHSRGPIAASATSRGHTPLGHRLPVPASHALGGWRVSHTSGLTISFLTPPLLQRESRWTSARLPAAARCVRNCREHAALT